MTQRTDDEFLDTRQLRRMRSEDRMLARKEKRETAAAHMIGELNSGKFYVYPVGGKYKEATNRAELIDYLIRNRYA